MAEIKKTFIAGRMNKDLDERLIPDGEYLDAMNVTIDTSGGSNIGAVSNSLGNTKVADIFDVLAPMDVVPVNPKTIGDVVYEAGNLIYWFVCADNFDGIFEYNQITGATVMVIGSTTNQLKFNKNYAITGVNFIPANRNLGPYLYWTDGLNPPRRISISRAKQWGLDNYRLDMDIDVVLRPPLHSPSIKLYNDTSVNATNNLEQRFIYFSYRYKYKDNQYSAISPFSAVSFHANSFSYDYYTGDNKGMQNKYNAVEVTIDSGTEFVDAIQLLFFDTYSANVYVVDTYDKSDMNWLDEQNYKIQFSNNKIYAPIENGQVTRLFDNVPLTAKAQDVIGNRLIYGNYVQFRDIVNSNNQKIKIDYTIELMSEPYIDVPLKTFRSDRDYEIGIMYLDDYGRMTTVLTSDSNTIYTPPTTSDKANSFKLTINNEPPEWATSFRFAIKQAKGDYYNIFPYTFISSGFYRYFLINEADKDKIVVGQYIIFKTSNGTPTYSNKQFKILELEQKEDNFIGTAQGGLYFKIKADPSDYFLSASSLENKYSDGSGRGINNAGFYPTNPVRDRSNDVNFDYCYYASNGDNTLIPSQNNSGDVTCNFIGPISNNDVDYRLSVLITNPSNPSSQTGTHFRWTKKLDGSLYSSDIPISDYIDITVDSTDDFRLYFQSGSNYNNGDLHVINVRGAIRSTLLPVRFSQTVYGHLIGTSARRGLFPYNDTTGSDYEGHSILNYSGPIYPGANIEINILRDRSSGPDRNINNSWISDNYYKNLEEWFWQSGAYASFKYVDNSYVTQTSPLNIIFRKAQVPPGKLSTVGLYSTQYEYEDPSSNGKMSMLIRGVGDYDGSSPNEILAELKIEQTPFNQKVIAETVPQTSDIDLFYELSKTYRIEDGKHKVSWRYSDYTDGGGGTTNLGPSDPANPTSNDMQHTFNVGEIIYVVSDNPSYGPASGTPYTIVAVPDNYSIKIDLLFPGSGPVTGGSVFYQDYEQDQDSTTPAIVEINHVTSNNSDFNAFIFGNGIESYRIYDNFLRPTMKYSPRATSVIENYQQELKEASLCYSGLYRGDSSLNRLNEFNLSLANFKNLDKSFGPVQKLYARDTDLLVFHQDKITSVLYGKNLLVDAVGGSQVASVPEVLGTQIAHPSEYGISNNPESFAKFSNILFFSDARRGAVLQMLGNEVIEISGNGMKNYFRDVMKDNPNTQKIGAFDPYNNTYVLSFNNTSVAPCRLSINPYEKEVYKEFEGNILLFDIESNTDWYIEQETSPVWFMLNNNSGSGNSSVYATIASPNEGPQRSIKLTVTYCEGKTVDFIFKQQGR